MENKKAHFFAVIFVVAMMYLAYIFMYEPYRAYEQRVLAIAAGEDKQAIQETMTYIDGQLPFLNMSEWNIDSEVQEDVEEGWLSRAFQYIVENVPFLSDEYADALLGINDQLTLEMPKVEGIVRVNADGVNIRTAPNPTDGSNIVSSADKGELYAYYGTEYYGNTPWYKILTEKKDLTDWHYISGKFSDVVADRSDDLTADELTMLKDFIQYTFEQRNISYKEYTTDTLLSYAFPNRNFSNEVVDWVNDMKSTVFNVKLLSADVIDGLKIGETTYWVRVQEKYDFVLKNGLPSVNLYSIDYIVQNVDGNLMIEEWFKLHESK